MQIRRAIEALSPYVPGERRAGAVKLSSNENPIGCSPAVREALRVAADEVHLYPDGSARTLVDALSRHIEARPEEIIVGNGSDEIITLIAATYIEPGMSVLIGAHTFSQYAYASTLFGARVRKVPMPALELRPEDFLSHIDDTTRIVFLCSPNNPTGTAFSHEQLVSFLDHLPDNVLVVVDQAYVEYQTDRTAAYADRLVNRYSNVIVLHTFSKIYGLAALRLGYGLACTERIADLQRVRPPFSVNSFAQAAGIAALSDTSFIKRSLDVNRRGMGRMQRLLDELGLRWLPSQANFITFGVAGAARETAAAIAEHGVTVRALGSFGLPSHIRVTVGTDDDIDRLERALREIVR